MFRATNQPSETTTDLLSQVYKGMDVYNSEGDKIATVDAVAFGAVNEASLEGEATAPATDERPIMPADVFAKVVRNLFDPGEIPDEVAERLRYSGFVRLNSGFFGGNRYIVPDQIDHVADDGIHLKVEKAAQVNEV